MIPMLIRLNNTTFVALCHQYDYTKSPYYGYSSYEDRNDDGYLNLFLYYTDKRLQNYMREECILSKSTISVWFTYTEFTGDKLFTKQSFRYRGIFFCAYHGLNRVRRFCRPHHQGWLPNFLKGEGRGTRLIHTYLYDHKTGSNHW